MTASVNLSTHLFFYHFVSVFQLIRDVKFKNPEMVLVIEVGEHNMSKVSVDTWECN